MLLYGGYADELAEKLKTRFETTRSCFCFFECRFASEGVSYKAKGSVNAAKRWRK